MIALNLGGVGQDAKIIYEIIDRALCRVERFEGGGTVTRWHYRARGPKATSQPMMLDIRPNRLHIMTKISVS